MATAIPQPVIQLLSAALAFIAIVAFAIMFGAGITQVWTASAGSPARYDQVFLYVATGIGTFVGGVVAVAFGVKPQPSNQPMVIRKLTTLGSVPFVSSSLRPFLGGLYAVVYFAFGVVALATVLIHPGESSDLVKNLAFTFFGLALPIAAAFFNG